MRGKHRKGEGEERRGGKVDHRETYRGKGNVKEEMNTYCSESHLVRSSQMASNFQESCHHS